MKKNLYALALLAALSVSTFAGDGQIGSTLAGDGQIGSTKNCPAQQTCLVDGQIGSTRNAQSTASEDTFGSLIESFVKTFLAQF